MVLAFFSFLKSMEEGTLVSLETQSGALEQERRKMICSSAIVDECLGNFAILGVGQNLFGAKPSESIVKHSKNEQGAKPVLA